MKVLVLWERSDERDYACNLAAVLEKMAGQLAAEAEVDKDGSITLRQGGWSKALPKVEVTAANYTRAIGPASRSVQESVFTKPDPDLPHEAPPITDPSVWLLQSKVRERDEL